LFEREQPEEEPQMPTFNMAVASGAQMISASLRESVADSAVRREGTNAQFRRER